MGKGGKEGDEEEKVSNWDDICLNNPGVWDCVQMHYLSSI